MPITTTDLEELGLKLPANSQQTASIKTQKDAILWHLETHGSITSWEAIKEYGVTRLSGIIYQLRKEGKQISAQDTKTKNRFGNSVTYATYRLIPNQTLF